MSTICWECSDLRYKISRSKSASFAFSNAVIFIIYWFCELLNCYDGPLIFFECCNLGRMSSSTSPQAWNRPSLILLADVSPCSSWHCCGPWMTHWFIFFSVSGHFYFSWLIISNRKMYDLNRQLVTVVQVLKPEHSSLSSENKTSNRSPPVISIRAPKR